MAAAGVVVAAAEVVVAGAAEVVVAAAGVVEEVAGVEDVAAGEEPITLDLLLSLLEDSLALTLSIKPMLTTALTRKDDSCGWIPLALQLSRSTSLYAYRSMLAGSSSWLRYLTSSLNSCLVMANGNACGPESVDQREGPT